MSAVSQVSQVSTAENEAAERYARQELLPEFAESRGRLAGARVGIAGCGGLGGLCAYLLAAAGVGTLHLSDSDVVSLSNLHRQVMYDASMIGRSKALCLQERIRALNAGIRVRTFAALTAENFAPFAADLDLLLLLTDSHRSRVLLSSLALRQHLDVIACAVTGFTGLTAAFFYSRPEFVRQYGCYSCLIGPQEARPGSGESRPEGISGPAAAQMAAAAAGEALAVLTGSMPPEHYGQLQLFDLKRQQTRNFKLKRSAGCRECRDAD